MNSPLEALFNTDVLRFIFERLAIGICISRIMEPELDAKIVYVSPHFAEVIGTTPDDMVGKRFGSTLSVPVNLLHKRLAEIIVNRFSGPNEFETVNCRGEKIYLLFHHFLLGRSHCLTVLQDETRAREVEKFLHQEAAALQHLLKNILAEKEAVTCQLLDHFEKVCMRLHDTLEPGLAAEQLSMHYQCAIGQLAAIRRHTDLKTIIDRRFETITPTEREIMAMLAAGKTTADIARDRCVAVRTVATHARNIRIKLGLVHRRLSLSDYCNILFDAYKIKG